MKKILLGIFFTIVLISYAQEMQNSSKNSASNQKEDIDFSIKESPIQDTSTQNIPDASDSQNLDKTSNLPYPRAQSNDNSPALAPEISTKNWQSTQEIKDKKDSSSDEIKTTQEDVLANPHDETKDAQATKQTIEQNNPQKKEIPSKEIKKKSTPQKKDFLEEKPQKTKKITFIQEEFYNPKKNDISVKKAHAKLFLQINSNELQKFMEGVVYNTKQQVQTFALEDSYTQITNVDGKIQEYKYAQKSIDRYSAIAPHQKYALKKISKKQYQIIVKKIPEFFDIKGCKIVIKKELTGSLNQTKEIIINLDTKRELRNNTHFDLFLECPQ